MAVELYIEGQRIDLFNDESINMKSSTQNINDISKVFADFSQSFTVPASKSNNAIFKHYYNADITGGFDARTKKSAEIYLNNLLYKRGKIRLNGTSLKENRISNYNIQFEGEVIKIKDLLGDDKLNTLELDSLNHTYNSANVKQGLETSLFSGDIIYPVISPERRFLYDSSDTITSDDTQTNIHYNSGIVDNSIEFNELKPAIKVSAVVDAIQAKYNLSFVGDFFNRDYYDKLYMWLNRDEGRLKTRVISGSNIVDWDGGDTDWVDLGTNTFTTNFSGIDNQFDFFRVNIDINVPIAFNDVEYNLVITRDGTEFYRRNAIKDDFSYEFIQDRGTPATNYDFQWFIEVSEAFQYDAELTQTRRTYTIFPGNFIDTTRITTASLVNVEGIVDVPYHIPDLKSYDFIVGLIKMFNIALTPNIDGSINWEVLPEWYNQGKVFKGFEKYIDIEKTDIKRGKLNNEFTFKYETPKTLLAEQFLDTNGVAYGDLEAKITDANGELLDGNKLEIKVPFEQIIYERITDLDTNNLVNLQYGFAVDKEQSPVVTKPILFYNNNQPINTIGFKNDNDTVSELNTTINIPNHCTSLTNNQDQTINFGAELSTYNFGLMETSLYNSFYKDYVTDMFSNQRRVYTYQAVIPEHILQDINLNDRLIISNRRYIINSIDSELTSGKTKLELLNDIYTAGDILGDSFYVNPALRVVDSNSGSYTVTVYGSGTINVKSEDEGDGKFITITSPLTVEGISTINYDVPVNNSGVERTQSIEFIQGENEVKAYITQQANNTDWSSTIITFDNDILTFDTE